MTSDRIPNTHTDRLEKQAQGVALMKSGSYVSPDFDAKEYNALTGLNRTTIHFEETKFVVIATGARGSLGRLAQISKDRKYARYSGGSIIPLALIHAETFSIAAFVKLILQSVAKTVEALDGRKFTGLLYGSIEKQYSTLWYVINGQLVQKDVETRRNDWNARDLVTVVETDLAKVEEVRKLMQGIA